MNNYTTLSFTFKAKDIKNTPKIKAPSFKDGFSEDVISHCKIASNKKLESLSRSEGGVCSDNEQRQIRFGFEYSEPAYETNRKYEIKHIVRNGVWTKAELEDIIQASIAAMHTRFPAYEVTGKIVGERFLNAKHYRE